MLKRTCLVHVLEARARRACVKAGKCLLREKKMLSFIGYQLTCDSNAELVLTPPF